MTVTLYGKPACIQCAATERALDKQGIEYTKVDVSVDLDALDYVRDLGYMQAPVVVVDGEHWSGFRPERIAALAA